MNKTIFFKTMKECEVNVSAHITIAPKNNGYTALVMNQSGAPNAFLSLHKDGSDTLNKTLDKYDAWLKEYFLKTEEINGTKKETTKNKKTSIDSDKTDPEIVILHDYHLSSYQNHLNDIDITHEHALLMNIEIDVLSQQLADRRCYWLSEKAIHNSQINAIVKYKNDAFGNGPRIAQHIVQVITISRQLSLFKTGLSEFKPKMSRLNKIDSNDIPF